MAVGDRVALTLLPDGSGAIESVAPRERMFSRMAPTARGEYQQIILANPDQVVFVFSYAEPEPRFGMLDRFLVIAEMQAVPALIVANKVDLVGPEGARALFGHYEQIGYPVQYTSARSGFGVAGLRELLTDRISVLMGPSGSGKSSLLNAIQPGLGLAVREVSEATQKGRHTTVVRQMFQLEDGGYVADTPGFRSLGLWDIEPEELDGYLPEFRSLVAECQFSDCTHIHEPGCAVRMAIEDGRVHPRRYQSYIRMRLGEGED